jgi:hypothetical protein
MQPPFPIPKGCEWQLLREEPLIVLTPASASVRDPHVALASEPFIRLVRGGWAGHLIDGNLRQARIRPRERFELDTFEAIAVMVDRGLGVSLVPDWAPPWPEGLSLSKLAVPNPAFTRYIGLLWMRALLRAPLVRAILEATETALAPRTEWRIKAQASRVYTFSLVAEANIASPVSVAVDSCVAWRHRRGGRATHPDHARAGFGFSSAERLSRLSTRCMLSQ